MPEPQMRADARRNRDRILAAAAAVFNEHGPTASTEEVARRAGVAIGTVFRHFPTKRDLLAAVMKDVRADLLARAEALEAGDDPEALFAFFAEVVERAAATRTVVALLAAADTDVRVDRQVAGLGATVQDLLDRAQRAGLVDPAVRADEVVALLVGACHGALAAGWEPDLRERAVARILNGLRR